MKKLKTIRKTLFVVYVALIMVGAITTPIYAANDPVTVVNNFSDFMFGMIRAIGMILLGFGIVQVLINPHTKKRTKSASPIA